MGHSGETEPKKVDGTCKWIKINLWYQILGAYMKIAWHFYKLFSAYFNKLPRIAYENNLQLILKQLNQKKNLL